MDDWRKMGPKNGENARRYAKKGYKPVPVDIKKAPRSWGERVIIPQSAALTAPNRCPSPLSLCDISPHCGESPLDKNKGSRIVYNQPPLQREGDRRHAAVEGLFGGSKPPPYGYLYPL